MNRNLDVKILFLFPSLTVEVIIYVLNATRCCSDLAKGDKFEIGVEITTREVSLYIMLVLSIKD